MCALVEVLTASVGSICRPCAVSVSRLVLAKMTARYGCSRPGLVIHDTSSVQSAPTPSAASQRIKAFCTTFAGVSGGFRPGPSRGPRLAWRGPAVRV
jgi:hypothetical protein